MWYTDMMEYWRAVSAALYNPEVSPIRREQLQRNVMGVESFLAYVRYKGNCMRQGIQPLEYERYVYVCYSA